MPTNLKDTIAEYYKNKPDFIQLWQQDQPTNIEEATEATFTATMPVHPAEENATGSITDQVAKESSDSTASSHGMHDVDNKVSSGGKATIQDHKATPGPVMAEGLGEPASKDELKKRAAELNK